jgi:uncharacterized protein (DUF1330 family)
MKQSMKLAITVLGGFAMASGGLHAQEAKKSAYLIADVVISDQAAYKAYAAKVPETLKPYNGRIVVRGTPTAKEGAPPQGIIVVIEFASLADAEKWYASPAYTALIPERQKTAKAQIYFVEGLPESRTD